MIENPQKHFLIQRSEQIRVLSEIPDARRAEHFLLHTLDLAARSARLASRLKISDEGLTKVVNDTRKRLMNLKDSLGDLHLGSASATRSAMPKFRGKEPNSKSVVGY